MTADLRNSGPVGGSADGVQHYGSRPARDSGPCPNCGHELADHAESGWGPHTVCVQKLDTFPDGGFHGVCPCVLRGGVEALPAAAREAVGA